MKKKPKATSKEIVFHEPPKFIQAWSVSRGYYGVTQALDSEGQVWERSVEMAQFTKGRKIVNLPTGKSWWFKLPMNRVENGDPAIQKTEETA